jgi:8-oxo-dGTP diphosphatase
MCIKNVVKSLILDKQGRYLMQLRDDVPTITFPGYWSLFGGAVENEETLINGIRRELDEELSFSPLILDLFLSYSYSLINENIINRKVTVFIAPIEDSQIKKLKLKEGENFSFMNLAELQKKNTVVPWDLCSVLMHHTVECKPTLMHAK